MRTICFRLGLICVSGFFGSVAAEAPRPWVGWVERFRGGQWPDRFAHSSLSHHHPDWMKLLPNRRGASLQIGIADGAVEIHCRLCNTLVPIEIK